MAQRPAPVRRSPRMCRPIPWASAAVASAISKAGSDRRSSRRSAFGAGCRPASRCWWVTPDRQRLAAHKHLCFDSRRYLSNRNISMSKRNTPQRRHAILALLNELGEVSVDELSRRFETSEVTIRKDLAALEKNGLLLRRYGGAGPVPPGIAK